MLQTGAAVGQPEWRHGDSRVRERGTECHALSGRSPSLCLLCWTTWKIFDFCPLGTWGGRWHHINFHHINLAVGDYFSIQSHRTS